MSNQSKQQEVRNSVRQILDEIDRDLDSMDLNRINALAAGPEPAPGEEDAEALLRAVEKRWRDERRQSQVKSFFVHAGRVCAALAVAGALTVGAASAFRWEAFLQFLQPLAEVFSLASYHIGEDALPLKAEEPAAGEEDEGEAIPRAGREAALYQALPNEEKPLRALLAVYPMTDLQLYSDEEIRFATLTLKAEGGDVLVDIQAVSDPEILSGTMFEYAQAKTDELSLNGVSVSLYQNEAYYGCGWTNLLSAYHVWNAPTKDITVDIAKILIGGPP